MLPPNTCLTHLCKCLFFFLCFLVIYTSCTLFHSSITIICVFDLYLFLPFFLFFSSSLYFFFILCFTCFICAITVSCDYKLPCITNSSPILNTLRWYKSLQFATLILFFLFCLCPFLFLVFDHMFEELSLSLPTHDYLYLHPSKNLTTPLVSRVLTPIITILGVDQ